MSRKNRRCSCGCGEKERNCLAKRGQLPPSTGQPPLGCSHADPVPVPAQIARLLDDTSCPCGSGDEYFACCSVKENAGSNGRRPPRPYQLIEPEEGSLEPCRGCDGPRKFLRAPSRVQGGGDHMMVFYYCPSCDGTPRKLMGAMEWRSSWT